MKRILLTMLALALALVPMTAGAAQENEIIRPYDGYTGTVTAVEDYYDEAGNSIETTKIVWIETEEQGPITFVVTEDTAFARGAKPSDIQMGDAVIGFYDNLAPAIMIYPPQYRAVAMAILSPGGGIATLDVFDGELLNTAQTLKLNMAEDTSVVNPDGTPYEGELGGRTLLVSYAITTKGIPAQTTPDEVVVLSQPDGEATSRLTIENAFIAESGALMLPLTPVAEALNLAVTHSEADATVTVGQAMLKIGEDYYAFARMAPVTLGQASQRIGAEVFVPAHFFTQLLSIDPFSVLSITLGL